MLPEECDYVSIDWLIRLKAESSKSRPSSAFLSSLGERLQGIQIVNAHEIMNVVGLVNAHEIMKVLSQFVMSKSSQQGNATSAEIWKACNQWVRLQTNSISGLTTATQLYPLTLLSMCLLVNTCLIRSCLYWLFSMLASKTFKGNTYFFIY